MKKLIYTTTFNASIDDVFTFHTDTSNLLCITPPWIGVKIFSIEKPFVEKSKVSLIIKRFGVSTRWVMEIEKLDFPHIITDKMVSGPFGFFQHQRRFTLISERQTKMEETITLELPWRWLTPLFFPLLKRDMDKMFAYRHRASSDFFMGKSS